MNTVLNNILISLCLFLLFGSLFAFVHADDHLGRQKTHSTEEGSDLDDEKLKPVSNMTYINECGSCHFAYQPELLPAKSWRKITKSVENHFGETLSVTADSINEINDYLINNGADRSSSKLSRKIMKNLSDLTPLRITEIPYIRKKHLDISPLILKQKAVGSLSNCLACHQTAEKGIYNDDSVVMPK